MYEFREANSTEFESLGALMVKVYSQLEGFPSEEEQPDYYQRLREVGVFTSYPKAKLFVAVSEKGVVDGGVVYFGDMRFYGAGGEATINQNAAAFRLLAVNPEIRGKGLGKGLIDSCLEQAKKDGHRSMVIHSTKTMMVAWKMYERMGFRRFTEIDFVQEDLEVYGFRLKL
ncbi:GNAT family N-acetyltransferase [Flavobacteriaceae bacterium S356]|uniref:GNAT family N-acetyltransferase n=1 Tax=Asprobacillus argus TaxID=3076534 RepID=A0ABU3LAH4_9FLAO|nr:GNAT family N-acetyltransferase [Flavobacteriaceae bacterium S356]